MKLAHPTSHNPFKIYAKILRVSNLLEYTSLFQEFASHSPYSKVEYLKLAHPPYSKQSLYIGAVQSF